MSAHIDPSQPHTRTTLRPSPVVALVPLCLYLEFDFDYVELTNALADALLELLNDRGRSATQTLLIEEPLETLALLYRADEFFAGRKETVTDVGYRLVRAQRLGDAGEPLS